MIDLANYIPARCNHCLKLIAISSTERQRWMIQISRFVIVFVTHVNSLTRTSYLFNVILVSKCHVSYLIIDFEIRRLLKLVCFNDWWAISSSCWVQYPLVISKLINLDQLLTKVRTTIYINILFPFCLD